MAKCPLVVATVVSINLALAGCAAHHRLISAEPEPVGNYRRVTTNAFAWGAAEPREPVKDCLSNAIDEVRVITSLPQALATVLTLGLWQPATIEYKCRAEPAQSGTFGQ